MAVRFLRFSLFTKILGWVFLNLLLVGVILLFIFNLDFRFSPQSPFFRESANRMETVSRLISTELPGQSRAERDKVLRKYSDIYSVDFFAFDADGNQIAGAEKIFPAEVIAEINKFKESLPKSNPFQMRPQTDSNGNKIINFPARRSPFFLRTNSPTTYWSGSSFPLFEAENQPPKSSILLASSDSISGNGLFFDPKPWLIIVGVISLFSILFWTPIVRRMTNTVGQMTLAAEKIAEEDFNVRVDEKRSDEFGRLGKAVNHLASKLDNFVSGQKRFLGAVSHELNSPLGRLQIALELIEDEANEKSMPYIEKAREEVQLMSKLVGEVLTYSKTGIKASEIEIESVNLFEVVENAASLENKEDRAEIKISIDEKTNVLANSEMLSRAIGNILRNSIRYATQTGEILVHAAIENEFVQLTISDNGTGVPSDSLEKIFDPFYRVQSDRSRASGGTGLGLAIVKTCVEACQGKVFARNREPNGLEIKMILNKA